jgi:hypothetical protein
MPVVYAAFELLQSQKTASLEGLLFLPSSPLSSFGWS